MVGAFKTATFENNIYTSNTSYPCNNQPCSSLVTYSDWNKINENDNNITITRTCISNNNICNLLDISDISRNINWTDTTECSKICNDGSGNGTNKKFVTIDNKTFYSNTNYPCNTETCSSLVNYGNWILSDQDISNGTINRTCTNVNNNRNACSIISNDEKSKTMLWTNQTDCIGACGTATYTKSFVFDGKTYNSNSFTCIPNSCSVSFNLNNFGNIIVSSSTLPQYGGLENVLKGGFYRSPDSYYNCNDISSNKPYNYKDSIVTIDNNNISHNGIWIQIQYPTPQIIKKYKFDINSSPDFPGEWVLLASNAGFNNNWTLLDNIIVPDTTDFTIFSINNNTAYTYYRFVFKRVKGNLCQSTLHLRNLILYI